MKKIVEAHHGSIRVQSTPGKGAKLIVEMPVSPRTRKAAIPEASAIEA